MKGIILKAISGFYYVESDGVIFECKARGSFRKAKVSPVVGDKVEFSITSGNYGVLEKVEERKNLLQRPPIANIDKLFIISSRILPSPDIHMIDRLTALAVFNNIEPIIVFNKSDIGDFDELQSIYKSAGFKTHTVSALMQSGLDSLKDEISGCVCAFVGNSGVGKSSIMNCLFPKLDLKTGEVSVKLGRGRHTTRHVELFKNSYGGYIADTPGFSSIESFEANYEFKEKLSECFPDFADYIYDCRFSSCSHTCEKGCALLNALKEGKIQPTRHESYCLLYEEFKSINKWDNPRKNG